jgi:hypothetical protein
VLGGGGHGGRRSPSQPLHGGRAACEPPGNY